MLDLFRSYKAGCGRKGYGGNETKKTTWNKTNKTKEYKQYNTKKTTRKKDKDELELGTWMLQLHAKGDGNSVRACSCDIHSVVGYYAMLCKSYSKIKMCEYEFLFGGRCKKKALQGSKYCILHVDLPEDEESDEFKRINELKEEKVKEKIAEGDFNFEGAKLSGVNFSGMTIEGSLVFCYAVIRNDVRFEEAKIGRDASFGEAEIGGDALFDEAEIGRDAWFDGAKIGGYAWFRGAEIGRGALFRGAEIGKKLRLMKLR